MKPEFKVSCDLRNLGKRIIKSPKLYFYDSGLLCYLLGISSPKDVMNYYQLGALFENYVIAERVKHAYHSGTEPRFYFYRDSNQIEVDLLEEYPTHLVISEIKANRTQRTDHLKHLHKVASLSDKPAHKILIYGGEELFETQGVTVRPWYSPFPDEKRPSHLLAE